LDSKIIDLSPSLFSFHPHLVVSGTRGVKKKKEKKEDNNRAF